MTSEDRELLKDIYEFMGYAKSSIQTITASIEKIQAEIDNTKHRCDNKCKECPFAQEFPSIRNKVLTWTGALVALGTIINIVIKLL